MPNESVPEAINNAIRKMVDYHTSSLCISGDNLEPSAVSLAIIREIEKVTKSLDAKLKPQIFEAVDHPEAGDNKACVADLDSCKVFLTVSERKGSFDAGMIQAEFKRLGLNAIEALEATERCRKAPSTTAALSIAMKEW